MKFFKCNAIKNKEGVYLTYNELLQQEREKIYSKGRNELVMKGFIKGAVLTAVLSVGATLFAGDVSAHGYIKEPASRAYMGSLENK